MKVATPHGPARVELTEAENARALLILGHGAGGGIQAPDIQAAKRAALEHRTSVALVEQPYRVAGRRSPAPAKQLDAAWISVVDAVRQRDRKLICGGRSAGARVACRTAVATEATAVICLAFPVHPPGRPEKSRLEELDAVTVPVLVIQGNRDPFGMPPEAKGRTLVAVHDDHSLKGDLAKVARSVGEWLEWLN